MLQGQPRVASQVLSGTAAWNWTTAAPTSSPSLKVLPQAMQVLLKSWRELQAVLPTCSVSRSNPTGSRRCRQGI